MSRLFDPFFSTKDIGLGSGLGLSISRSIVEGYGGTIEVESEGGRGSSFVVRLPIPRQSSAPQASAQGRSSPAPAVRGRVLVVDDEESVRATVRRILRAHEVVEAANGREAREILEADRAFDLILCDLMMPEVSGMDLHEWLTSEHPSLAARVVFVTGGAFTPRAKAYLRGIDTMRLEKPFDPPNFLKIVNTLIAASRAKAE